MLDSRRNDKKTVMSFTCHSQIWSKVSLTRKNKSPSLVLLAMSWHSSVYKKPCGKSRRIRNSSQGSLDSVCRASTSQPVGISIRHETRRHSTVVAWQVCMPSARGSSTHLQPGPRRWGAGIAFMNHRDTLMSSMLLYHLSRLRLSAPLEELHHVSYRADIPKRVDLYRLHKVES